MARSLKQLLQDQKRKRATQKKLESDLKDVKGILAKLQPQITAANKIEDAKKKKAAAKKKTTKKTTKKKATKKKTAKKR